MTRNELLQYCRYYKGENVCSFEEQTKKLFWQLEKQYINAVFSGDGKERSLRQRYLFRVQTYILKHKNEVNLLTSDKINKEQKAIILFCEDMLRKWMPRDVDIIFKY